MNDFHFERYGFPKMSLEEELNLPKNAKRTEMNKIMIVDRCDAMINLVEQIRFRARNCPIEDSERHANLVEEFALMVKEADKALLRAATYGME